jgi:fucose permease
MMMGLIGGAIFPPIMGFVADISGSQLGAIIVMTVGVLYVAATAVTPVLFRTVSSAR